MAQDAELKLKVSLDLAFFRQQISTISTQLGGQSIQLNVKFDRKAIADQYRLLDNTLSRKTFKVKIESPTLDALVKQVGTFKKNLAALEDEKINLAVNVVSNIDEIRKSIKSKLPSVQVQTELAEPVNVDDFIREVGKKVKGQVERSYVGGGIPIATKLETPGTTSLIKALQKNFNNQDPLRAKVSTTPSIIGEDVKAFRDAVKEKFSGISVKIKAELEGAGANVGGQGGRNFSQAALRKLGQDIKPLYRAAADAGLVEFNESIANNIQSIAKELSAISADLIEGLLNGLKSKDPQVKAAAKSLGQALISSIKGILGIASPSKVFKAIGEDVGKGFEIGAVASMDKAFDALEKKLQERLKKLQTLIQPQASRRGAFPFVAKSGPIESSALLAESASLAAQIDQVRAQLVQIQERRQGRLSFERGALVQTAGRLLPPARDRSLPAGRETIFPGGGALDQVTQGFLQSLKNAKDTFDRNFSANSYLPRATRDLASSMQQASHQIKAIAGARGPIAALPPAGFAMEQRQFRLAIMAAIKADMQNALRQQMQGRMLPAAGQTSYRDPEQRRFQESIAKAAAIDAENAAKAAARTAREQTRSMITQVRSEMMRFALPAAGQTTASRMTQQMFAGLSPLQAPGIGTENIPLSRAASYMLTKANRTLGLPIGPSSPLGSMGQFPMSGMMGRGSMGRFPMDDYLAIGGASAIGQSRAGSTPWLNTLRGAAGGYIPGIRSSARFPMAGMMGPSSPLGPLGQITAQSSMFAGGGGAAPPGGGGGGGFGGMGGAGGFGRAMGGIGNLPGAGTIKELGSEFAFATKQVLLFGQAYKLLGFAQDFPGQVAAAVSSLQSFRNTLLSVTGSASAAADANEFILAAVEKYSIPLQSARDGFTKLFASMEPAGFAAGEIQNLFLGISKAAATYGMSADKVDRVNYAFAQMASKGQVMSEELKGQLGDVLPGAMGIFAKAAGFEGPDAIQKFGKALEDGEYKGGKMRELLRNVANEMNKEFGPGAEGAARTFQGAINRMQTATAKLYESFEPAAIGVMNAVMVPFVQTLKNATDGINAYFSGQEAATPAAQGFADILKTLVPTLTGIGENLKYVFQQVAVLIQGFGAFALQVGRLLALPIVRYLAGTYVQTLLLTTAFKALATSGIGAALVAVARFIAQGFVYAQVTLGMRVATQQTTVAMYQFGTAVQTVMIKSVIGIALVAISAFIARIVELRGQLAAISGDAKSMEDLAKSSAKLGDVGATKEAVGNIKDRLETYKQLKEEIQAAKKAEGLRGEGATAGMTQDIKLTTRLGNKLVELGLINKRVLQTSSNGYKANELALDGVLTKVNENISSFDKAGQKGAQYIDQAIKQNKKLQEQGIAGVETPDEKNQKAAEKAAEEARKLADDKRKYEGDLMKLSSAQAINLNEMEFDHWKSLQQAKYDFLEAGQNEWMGREIKFQRDLQAIEIRRIEAIRRARIDTVKAETDAQVSAYVAGGGGGVTGLMQGSTGISSGPHFDVRRADRSRITEAEARAMFDPSVRRRLQMTSGYGNRIPPVPGASSFHPGIDLAGPANTPLNLAPGYSMQSAGMEGGLGYTANIRGPQGEMYKVGHLQQPSAGMPASRVRAEAKKDYASALASQEAINAKERENAQIKYANIQAQQELNILIREYTASIVPVEQQKLENNLLQNRISLISSGVFGEALDTEQKISEAREKAALGTQMANAQIEQNNKLVKDGIISQEQADKLNASQVEKIKQLTQGLEAYIPLLKERLQLEQSGAEATLRGEIQRATPLGGMGLSAGFIGPAGAKFEEAIGRGATQDEASRFAELQNQLTLLETRNEAIKQSIYGIGNAFGEALTTGVASLIAGTATAKEVFASFLQSVGQALSQAASQMIATYIAIGIAKIFAGLGGGGGADMSKTGISETTLAPMRQYSMEGPLTGAAGFAGYANGGIVPGGFQAFANGGVVSGPTLGLVGEGKYNEAVVPLPNGKSIPVQFSGERSARDMMSRSSQAAAQASPINLSFETTKIGNTEYVSRDQLEAAMAETRRAAINGGAARGMSMTLDRIQQSPSVRSRIGIR